jgi:hypothetical protein
MDPAVLDTVVFFIGMALAASAAVGFFIFAGVIGLKPSKVAHRPHPIDQPAVRHARELRQPEGERAA